MRNFSVASEFILLGLSEDAQVQALLFVAFLVIYVLTLTGNSMILLVIRVDAHLRSPMYFFLGHLSFLDLLYSSVSTPKMLENLVSETKTIPVKGCLAQAFFVFAIGGTEALLLAVMAYDRFVAICYPMRYTVIMNPRVCTCFTVGTWLGGFVHGSILTFLIFKLPYCGPNEINHFFCEIPAVLKLACADTSLNDRIDFILGFILLLVPLSFILASYVCIFATILRIRSAQGRLKAFSTCASHITVVTMFCGPAMFMYMNPGANASPERDKKLALFYNVISAFLNPIIYSLRNKDVKRAFLKVTGCGRPPE